MLPWQPIKFSDLDKIHMNHRGLLKKHFCRKKNLNLCSETAKIANFHFSHYKSMETISCHSNQSFYPVWTKTHLSVPPAYRCYMWNMEKIRSKASEEMSFKNVDGRRMPAYTIGSRMSLRLRWAKNGFIHWNESVCPPILFFLCSPVLLNHILRYPDLKQCIFFQDLPSS